MWEGKRLVRLVMRSKEVKVISIERDQQYQNIELFFERFDGERKKFWYKSVGSLDSSPMVRWNLFKKWFSLKEVIHF